MRFFLRLKSLREIFENDPNNFNGSRSISLSLPSLPVLNTNIQAHTHAPSHAAGSLSSSPKAHISSFFPADSSHGNSFRGRGEEREMRIKQSNKGEKMDDLETERERQRRRRERTKERKRERERERERDRDFSFFP